MNRMSLIGGVLAATMALAAPAAAQTEVCRVAWSHYTGWEPMQYIEDSGLADEYGERYGVEIDITLFNDYVESLTQFTAGEYDFVTSTTIDALTIPAAGGTDTTVLVVGDYSNGNDAVLVVDRDGSIDSFADLPAGEVLLVEYSISDYLFGRALDIYGMDTQDYQLVHTSDADIGNVFASAPEGAVVVTWNPIVMTALDSVSGATSVFDSSRIPGEILDTIIAHTDTSPACMEAVAGAWYTAMDHMSGNAGDDVRDAMIASMAEFASGGGIDDPVGWFEAQLRTTEMFYTPAEALEVMRSGDLIEAHDYIRQFALDRGLLGEMADSADFIGIEFPDGTILGDPNNVMLRFDDSYTSALVDDDES